jgi:hypothetical protein
MRREQPLCGALRTLLVHDPPTDQKYEHDADEHPQHIHDDSFQLNRYAAFSLCGHVRGSDGVNRGSVLPSLPAFGQAHRPCTDYPATIVLGSEHTEKPATAA